MRILTVTPFLLSLCACDRKTAAVTEHGPSLVSKDASPKVLDVVDGAPSSELPLVEQMLSMPKATFSAMSARCDAASSVKGASRTPQLITVEPFQIDSYLVSCDAFERCVRSGICDEKRSVCWDGALSAPRESAEHYCKWRGARLPSYLEWQRAVRGDEGDPPPEGKTPTDAAPCGEGQRSGEACHQVTGRGLHYRDRYGEASEWTGENGCDAKNGEKTGPVSAILWWHRLDVYAVNNAEAQFRCARSVETPVQK